LDESVYQFSLSAVSHTHGGSHQNSLIFHHPTIYTGLSKLHLNCELS
jgi:hypothetical protein